MKRFLQKNEIYFTTIAATLLSIMAIVVSVIACTISYSQYQNDKYDKKPDFQIQKEIRINPLTNYYEDTYLIISKLSGKAKNISINTISFIDVKMNASEKETKHKRFALYNYFETSFISGINEGILQTTTGYKNNLKIIDFTNSLDSILSLNNQTIVNIQTETYVKISFLDFKQKHNTEYFQVDTFQGNIINNIGGEKLFEEHKTLTETEKTIQLNFINEMDLSKIIKMVEN